MFSFQWLEMVLYLYVKMEKCILVKHKRVVKNSVGAGDSMVAGFYSWLCTK